jgi:GNAT superfamily N-acetyltransferase
MTKQISGKSLAGAPHINTIIRTARVDDAACIAVLATQVWLHTYATQGISAAISQYTRTQLIPEKYLALLDDPLARLWVAELYGCLVAFAVVKFDAPCPVFAPGSAELQTLYVQEHFVGQGVGQQLGAGQLGLAGTGQGIAGAQAGMQGIGQAIGAAGQGVTASMVPQDLYNKYASVIFGTPSASYGLGPTGTSQTESKMGFGVNFK